MFDETCGHGMGHHPFVDHRRFRPATLADRPRNLAIGHPDDYDLAANFEARKYGYSLSDEADLRSHCGKG